MALTTTIAIVTLVGVSTTAATPAGSTVMGADAPHAATGPHAVGIERLDPVEGLPGLTHWYPATPGAGGDPVVYDQRLLVVGPGDGVTFGTVDGIAVRDAAAAELSPPLVVLAPGYGIAASSYGWLAEHLASHGFAVVAHEAEETLASAMADGLWQSAGDRPAALADTVAHLRGLARTGRADWDPDRLAVIGHSIGGHAALAVAGARLDTDAFAARCATGDQDAAWLCDVLVPDLDSIADRTDEVRPTVPTASTDVDAVVVLAGDAYLFDSSGLGAVTTPVLAVGGLDDTGTPWSLGAGMTFESAGSDRRVAVALAGAEHLVFTGRCDRHRRVTPLVPMDLCEDPDGERATRHDVIAHVTTAFLIDELTGDDGVGAVLDDPTDLPFTTIVTDRNSDD